MKSKNVSKFFRDKFTMYQHLESIRDNLWSKDGKSRVSVMVGAGFSLNASKIEENFKGMALWDDLKATLMEKLKHHLDIEYKDVLEIGQIYESEYGRASLEEILKEAIPDDNYEPDTLHYNFLNLPWADIYTTNYDTLLERARRQIYERKYQVIYDMNDIPNSTSPRIIKLHGSFPSNRPFIFTENDYDRYPKKFSPFVNMVQQSIMETTFVLLGFSGDDPNFEKWTTWVKENLGEHMPKIYMVGYGQKKRLGYLKSKGITLLDFEDLYFQETNPYTTMFTDLFEYLAYKDREEKTKWPYKNYNKYNLSLGDLKYNREHYPGWIVMPNHIRRANAEAIRFFGNKKISEIESLDNKQDLDYLKELLWCYKQFYIPLDFYIQEHLQKLITDIADNKSKEIKNFYNIISFLLNRARFDGNKDSFYKFESMLEKSKLNKSQCNELIYEEVLLNLAFNSIDYVKQKLNMWEVGEKEIEWGIKKAAILLRINELEEAQVILEGYLQTIRNLLAIQSDEYRLLSLESIALQLLGRIYNERDYGYDRLRILNLKNCNVNKEFEHMIMSIKPYEYDLGTKETPSFDPGRGQISSKMGDYFRKELFDSYAVLYVKELFDLFIIDKAQYELGLKNLEILFPIYSLINRIHFLEIKRVDNIFSREYVYQLNKDELLVIIEVLKDSIERKECSVISEDIALEIISRIYFALPSGRKEEIDSKIVDFINEKRDLKNNLSIRTILINLLKRVMFDKNELEQKVFCEKLFELNIKSQWQENEIFYKNYFFEPFLEILTEKKDIKKINVSENKIVEMLGYLEDTTDKGIKESALIRLTFLAITDSLTEDYREKFVEILKTLPKNNDQGISDYIYSHVLDKIINLSTDTSSTETEVFVEKEIPKFYKFIDEFDGMGYSNNGTLSNYFKEINGVFPDIILKKSTNLPETKYYRLWLSKFYLWWDDQEQGLLRDIKDVQDNNFFLKPQDYLKYVVICLKNNILSVAPLEAFDEKDKEILNQIFEKIDNKRPDLSFLLVPSFQRLTIPIKYSYEDIIKKLKSKDSSAVQVALHCIYDYFALIDNQEIELESNVFKSELLPILYYSSGDVFKSTIDSFKYSLKHTPNIFNENDCSLLLDFFKEYLELIKSDKIRFSTLKDFEVISSVAGLVTYLSRNNIINDNNTLKDWKEYIKNHNLPEVRKYSDLININL